MEGQAEFIDGHPEGFNPHDWAFAIVPSPPPPARRLGDGAGALGAGAGGGGRLRVLLLGPWRVGRYLLA